MEVEYGIRLASPTALPGDPRDACPAAWRDLLPEGPGVALYFGTEFCEDRLPGVDEAASFCTLACERGWEPTLLTPLVTTSALDALDRVLAAIAARGFRPAVVFNDWGVLALLREAHPSLPRRAGRLINRSLRDPRAYQHAPAGGATHDASRYARLRGFLARAGVTALETDADLEGGYLGAGPEDGRPAMRRALHVPYTFAASGRSCPLKSARYPEGGGFSKALADACPAPCRTPPMAVRRDDCPMPLWRAGNTVFYEMPAQALQGWLQHTDRIVLHSMAAP